MSQQINQEWYLSLRDKDMSKIVSTYLESIQITPQDITYELYCEIINDQISLDENIMNYIKNLRLSRELVIVFRNLKSELSKIAQEFKLNYSELIKAFQHKDAYKVLKAFGFNLVLLFKGMNQLTSFIHGGLLEVFRAIHRTKAIQKLRSGALKVDEFLDQYPILKKVGGVAVAALLVYLWINMTFIGNLDYDFNFSDVVAALKGTFTITNLFLSPEGLMLVSLFGTGVIFGLSIPWLGKTLYNLILAIFYTIYSKIKGDKDILQKVKNKMLSFSR